MCSGGTCADARKNSGYRTKTQSGNQFKWSNFRIFKDSWTGRIVFYLQKSSSKIIENKLGDERILIMNVAWSCRPTTGSIDCIYCCCSVILIENRRLTCNRIHLLFELPLRHENLIVSSSGIHDFDWNLIANIQSE